MPLSPLQRRLTREIGLLRYMPEYNAKADSYDDAWGAPVAMDAMVSTITSTEISTSGTEVVSRRLVVRFPRAIKVQNQDRLQIAGETYEIEGDSITTRRMTRNSFTTLFINKLGVAA